MKRVFEESGVGDVVVNIRILNVLQTVCMKSLKNMPESLETMTESVVLNIFDQEGDLICLLINTRTPSHWLKSVA